MLASLWSVKNEEQGDVHLEAHPSPAEGDVWIHMSSGAPHHVLAVLAKRPICLQNGERITLNTTSEKVEKIAVLAGRPIADGERDGLVKLPLHCMMPANEGSADVTPVLHVSEKTGRVYVSPSGAFAAPIFSRAPSG